MKDQSPTAGHFTERTSPRKSMRSIFGRKSRGSFTIRDTVMDLELEMFVEEITIRQVLALLSGKRKDKVKRNPECCTLTTDSSFTAKGSLESIVGVNTLAQEDERLEHLPCRSFYSYKTLS